MISLFKKYKFIFALALPIIIQNLVTAFAQLIDNVMVSNLGVEATAGVGAASTLFFLVMFTGIGISEGGAIFIARLSDQNKEHEQRKILLITVLIAVTMGIVLVFIFGLLTTNIIGLFIDPASNSEAYENGVNYLAIVKYSYIFIMINLAIGTSFRAISKPKYTLIAGSICVITNTVLNACLIYGLGFFPELGVEGAAIATIIARIVETIVLLLILSTTYLLPKLSDIALIKVSEIKQVVLKAAPLVLNGMLWSVGYIFILYVYSSFGVLAFSSMQIVNIMLSVMFTVTSGIGNSISVYIASGYEKISHSELYTEIKNILKMCLYIGMFLAIISFCLSFIVPFMYPNMDELVVTYASTILRLCTIFFPLYMISAASFFILRSLGDMFGVLFMDSLFTLFITMPILLIVILFFNVGFILMFVIIQSIEASKIIVGHFRIKRSLKV